MEKKGNLNKYIRSLLKEQDEQVTALHTDYTNGGRSVVRTAIDNWIKENILKGDHTIYFKPIRNDYTGHTYPAEKVFEVVDIKCTNIHNSGIAVNNDNDTLKVIYTFNANTSYLIDYIDSNGIIVRGDSSMDNREFEILVENNKDIYYLSRVLSDIKKIETQIETKKAEIATLENSLANNKWIKDFMKANKIKKELKATVKTKMIVEMMSSEDKSAIESNINEVLSMDV